MSTLSSIDKKQGGIAWGGSLVGSHNPSNLGYRESYGVLKKFKVDHENEDTSGLPSSIIIQFRNKDGLLLGEAMDIPTNSSCEDLQTILKNLLEKSGEYSIRATIDGEDVEVTSNIAVLLKKHNVSTERVLELTYHPLALFRVRPVTRCADTLPGHSEAVLHVSFSPDGKTLASGGGDTIIRFW